MFFKFRSKNKVPIYPHPPGWPSPLHNKCSNPHCRYPNLPQAAEGRYDCKAVRSGFYCEGVYYVTAAQVQAVMKKHYEEVRREDIRRRAAEDEAERQRALALKQEEEARRLGYHHGHGHGHGHGPSEHAARHGSERQRHPRTDDHRDKYEASRRGPPPTSRAPPPPSRPQSPLERRPAQRKHHAADPNVFGPGTFEHPRQAPPPRAVPIRLQQSYEEGPNYPQNHDRYASDASQGPRHAAHSSSRHGRSRAQSRPEVPPRGWI